MKVEIPAERIDAWKKIIETEGYDAPETADDWLRFIAEIVETELEKP